MIRIVEVECIRSSKVNNKEFVHGVIYKGYMKNGRYVIYNDERGIPFDVHIPGRLRYGGEKYFKSYFVEKNHDYVKDKKELREYFNI